MSTVNRGLPAAHGPQPTSDEAKLRRSAKQLESVFVLEMMKAMRKTVPTDGLTAGGPGEEMFRGMLDERMASDIPASWEGPDGLGERLYQQLRARLDETVRTPDLETPQ